MNNVVVCVCVCQELCLQTKLLAPPSCQVAEFLSKAPQPPPAYAIKNALQILKVAPLTSTPLRPTRRADGCGCSSVFTSHEAMKL